MASASIFKRNDEEPPSVVISDNMEGVVLLKIILQNLRGPIVANIKMDILTMVMSRLNSNPMS